MAITLNPEVRKAALEIIRENREAEPALQDIYGTLNKINVPVREVCLHAFVAVTLVASQSGTV